MKSRNNSLNLTAIASSVGRQLSLSSAVAIALHGASDDDVLLFELALSRVIAGEQPGVSMEATCVGDTVHVTSIAWPQAV